MPVVDPPGTLLRCAALSLLLGAGCALLAAAVLYGAATRTFPRVEPRLFWTEWRRRWKLWLAVPALGAAAALLAGEWVLHSWALRDLYWRTRAADAALLCRLGAACGFLLANLALVLRALRRKRPRRGARPD